MASGIGWNLWVSRYIDFLILLIPTPLVSGAGARTGGYSRALMEMICRFIL